MAAISAVSAIAVAAVTCDVQHRTSFTYHSSSSTLHFPISKSHISLARRSVADLAVQWGKRISDTGAAVAGVVCRSGYNVQVVVGEDEHEEILVRRFKREVFKAGVINECKRRKFFENKQDEKKRKRHEAGRRNRKRRFVPRIPTVAGSKGEDDVSNDNGRDGAGDNWEMPQNDGSFPL